MGKSENLDSCCSHVLLWNMTVFKRIIIAFFLGLVPVLLLISSVSAQTTVATRAGSTRLQNRLNEVKMRVCRTHEETIKNRMSSLTRMATNMFETFDSIATRVETYYTEKVVPGGKTVPDYEDLVSSIASKKMDTKDALLAAQNDRDTFSCEGDNPKGLLTTFRKDMQEVKSSLKDYRTAIKDLIVAIRSSTSDTGKKERLTPRAGGGE